HFRQGSENQRGPQGLCPWGNSDQWALKTVWGVGYKFEVAPPGGTVK
ncbi:MAG TPA: hypothetical protein IAC25_04135, partial [Candidatus Enterenecus stercoripullorum]|nr:hypothetical protein [Candidatus Enterenecus stercoripullorum]